MVEQIINSQNKHIWEMLKEVPDPEIPIINLVELGVIREVEFVENKTIITITPTYTGCPAKKLFNDLILEKMSEKGIENVEIKTVLTPAWNTGWLSDATKAKMLKEGISPPSLNDEVVRCPNCQSVDTKEISKFGSTPCQAMYSCNSCLEPFNYFKCHR